MKNKELLVRSDIGTNHPKCPRAVVLSVAVLLSIQSFTPAMAEQQAVSTSKSISEIRDIFSYFHTPANVVQIQVASDKTLYAWQNMSAFQYTMQIERDGPISLLPEKN